MIIEWVKKSIGKVAKVNNKQKEKKMIGNC